MKKLLLFIPIFLIGCACCNTFMPHEELTYYMTAGYIQGYKCQKSGVEINHCLYKHIEKNYKYSRKVFKQLIPGDTLNRN